MKCRDKSVNGILIGFDHVMWQIKSIVERTNCVERGNSNLLARYFGKPNSLSSSNKEKYSGNNA